MVDVSVVEDEKVVFDVLVDEDDEELDVVVMKSVKSIHGHGWHSLALYNDLTVYDIISSVPILEDGY